MKLFNTLIIVGILALQSTACVAMPQDPNTPPVAIPAGNYTVEHRNSPYCITMQVNWDAGTLYLGPSFAIFSNINGEAISDRQPYYENGCGSSVKTQSINGALIQQEFETCDKLPADQAVPQNLLTETQRTVSMNGDALTFTQVTRSHNKKLHPDQNISCSFRLAK